MSCCNNDCNQGRLCPCKRNAPTLGDSLYVVGVMAILAICIGMLCKLWSMS